MYLLSLLSFFVLIAIVVFSGVSLEINYTILKPWIRWTGGAIFFLGYAMRLWAWGITRKYDIRDIAYGPLPQKGIYRIMKHPKLWGAFMMYTGLAIGVSSVVGIFLCLLIILPITLYRIKVYEGTLTELVSH